MILCQIAAMSKNRVIGVNNKLPWDIPADMKFFRKKTSGAIVIMGRKTFESIGRPLPKRLNIVVSRTMPEDTNGVLVVRDIDGALKTAGANVVEWSKEVFIIGGAEIYEQTLNLCDRLYLSEIQQTIEGDSFFPSLDSRFTEVERKAAESDVPFDFVQYDCGYFKDNSAEQQEKES